MLDWERYADLAFIGALDAWHRGNAGLAVQRFRKGMETWNGTGFADAAFMSPGSNRLYATYKLALAVRTAAELRIPLDSKILERLLAQQEDSGGFVTLYDGNGAPQGDPNTETSSYALLALLAWSKQ